MSGFDELLDLKKQYEDKLKKDGESIVKGALAEFFATFPEVEALRWDQFTPYFNDGEACVFTFRGLHVKIKNASVSDEVKEEINVNDFLDIEYDLYDWDDVKKEKIAKKGFEKLYEAGLKLNGQLGQVEDALETVFGDHSQVTVTSDGKVEIEDRSDHD